MTSHHSDPTSGQNVPYSEFDNLLGRLTDPNSPYTAGLSSGEIAHQVVMQFADDFNHARDLGIEAGGSGYYREYDTSYAERVVGHDKASLDRMLKYIQQHPGIVSPEVTKGLLAAQINLKGSHVIIDYQSVHGLVGSNTFSVARDVALTGNVDANDFRTLHQAEAIYVQHYGGDARAPAEIAVKNGGDVKPPVPENSSSTAALQLPTEHSAGTVTADAGKSKGAEPTVASATVAQAPGATHHHHNIFDMIGDVFKGHRRSQAPLNGGSMTPPLDNHVAPPPPAPPVLTVADTTVATDKLTAPRDPRHASVKAGLGL